MASTMNIETTMLNELKAHAEHQAEQIDALSAKLDQLLLQKPVPTAEPKTKTKTKTKKPAAENADGSAKTPSAWNILVAETVADMKQNGWPSWTDLKGVVWPASRPGTAADKGGVGSHVYDGGDHDGKAASPALGGMVRASCLKSQSDPIHAAKAHKYHETLAEKRSAPASAAASVGEAAPAEEPVADEPKKAGRPKMTEEQKAAAKVKREAKKATEAVPPPPTTPAPPRVTEGVAALAAALATTPPPKGAKAPLVPRKPVEKKTDLRFFIWEHEGEKYLSNDRADVLTEDGEWVGRFDGKVIDESVTEPTDLEGVEMRD